MTNNAPIRLILIDDHSKVHLALSALLMMLDDIELVAQGGSGEEAIQLCNEHEPDIVLMDVIMPSMDGVEATRHILENHPQIKIIALSGYKDQESVQAMIDAGAIGYLLKTSSVDDISHTIRSAFAGNIVFSQEVAGVLLKPQSAKTTDPKAVYGITDRELEVLALMVKGFSNAQIAEALTIATSTVKFHVSSILAKLNVTTRIEAVVLSVEQRLVS